jgi:hypothetical protein
MPRLSGQPDIRLDIRLTSVCDIKILELNVWKGMHHWLRCDMHSGVIDTAVQICEFWEKNSSGVIDSAVMCTAESLTPLCKYDTAVTFDIIFARLWLPLKGISIEETYIYQLSFTITFTHKNGNNKRSFLVTAESLTPLLQKSAITKSISSANTIPYSKRL